MTDTINFEIGIRNGNYFIETKHPDWECFNEHFSRKEELLFWMEQISVALNNHPVTPVGVSFTLA